MDKKVINIINDNCDISYELKENEMLIINYYNNMQNNINVDIIQGSNSYLVINMACFINRDSIINVNCKVNGNDNKTVINLRTIGVKNEGVFNVNVNVSNDTINNEIIEDLKGINEDGIITFLPILEMNTCEVNASHFATVGGFDEKIIFYLESKGLDNKTIIKMLKDAFIKSLFDEKFLGDVMKGSEFNE